MTVIDLEDVKALELDDTILAIKNGDTLTLHSKINTSVIDKNFNILESEIKALKSRNDYLMSRIDVLQIDFNKIKDVNNIF